MQATMTAERVADARMMAVWRRGASESLVHYSERNSQYTSEAFQRLLTHLRLTCSMSRSGNVWDNSVMEAFFSTLKTELTARHHYRTRNAARADIFDFIERFYNPIRRHSMLGNLSPVNFERGAAVA